MNIAKKYLTGRRNYVSTNRNWVTVKRHLPIVLKPLLVALLGLAVWKFLLVNNGIHFVREAENPLLFLILPLVSFIYVIFASIAVGSVFEEYKTIARSVVGLDLETFLLHRDEQLPILVNILVAAPSIILIALVLLFPYQDTWVGIASVFTVIFVVSTTWIVATELDDYESGIWFKEKVPEDWHKIDIEEYFKDKRKLS